MVAIFDFHICGHLGQLELCKVADICYLTLNYVYTNVGAFASHTTTEDT